MQSEQLTCALSANYQLRFAEAWQVNAEVWLLAANSGITHDLDACPALMC
jgi:hypothetical protein